MTAQDMKKKLIYVNPVFEHYNQEGFAHYLGWDGKHYWEDRRVTSETCGDVFDQVPTRPDAKNLHGQICVISRPGYEHIQQMEDCLAGFAGLSVILTRDLQPGFKAADYADLIGWTRSRTLRADSKNSGVGPLALWRSINHNFTT